MAYDFNADEIFEVAVKIEENGAAFYRKASSLQEDPANREFLEKLAGMEDGHQAAFQSMRKKISDMEKQSTVFDPQEELPRYLAAMADSHGGEGSPVIADSLTGEETMEQIIRTAIGLEKESILFYLGLKDLVPENMGKEKIDDIIKEERRHIIQLDGFLKRIP